VRLFQLKTGEKCNLTWFLIRFINKTVVGLAVDYIAQ